MAQQFRKQIMDENGQYVPVEDTPQIQNPSPPDHKPVRVGHTVTLTGEVLDVQHPQAGLENLLVQLPAGQVWLKREHVSHATNDLQQAQDSNGALVEANNVLRGEHSKRIAEIADRDGTIGDLKTRINTLEAQLAAVTDIPAVK